MRIAQFTREDVRKELLQLLKAFAFEKRSVTLANGQSSNFYIDCKKVSFRADGAKGLAILFFEAMQQLERRNKVSFAACGGMAIGAIPLSTSLSLEALSHGRVIHSICVRKTQKDHGTCASVEGGVHLEKGAHVLLLEDVVTTGGSTINAATALRDAGYVVQDVIAIVDREASGEENLKEAGLSLKTFFNLSDFYQNE